MKRTHAVSGVTVHQYDRKPYDRTAGPTLMEIVVRETFTGDIEAEATARSLQIQHDDGSAEFVAVNRLRGTLGGRHGTFVLQGPGIVENGKVKATWTVVAKSGTDELCGLRGEGRFEGEVGKGSEATLDYWFEEL
jgi:hypothetical protein